MKCALYRCATKERVKCTTIRLRAHRALRRARQAALIKKFDKARQNRTFAKRYLERDDCSARSAAQAERGEFPRKSIAHSRATRRGKRGKQQRSRSGFPLKQAKNEKADAACAAPALFLFVFCLIKNRQRPILPGRSQVHSALRGLTSVFGMGTGGSLLLSSPVWLSVFCTLTTTQHSP